MGSVSVDEKYLEPRMLICSSLTLFFHSLFFFGYKSHFNNLEGDVLSLALLAHVVNLKSL